MAKGKKSKSSGLVSKGERPNVSRSISNAVRRDDTRDHKFLAWQAGKNPMVTIPNPNKEETNRPFIRVPANSREAWGDPRARFKM